MGTVNKILMFLLELICYNNTNNNNSILFIHYFFFFFFSLFTLSFSNLLRLLAPGDANLGAVKFDGGSTE